MTGSKPAATTDSRPFRDVMGHFATGVAVLTVRDREVVHGSTVNSLTSVSLQPALLLVCLAGDGLTARLIRSARRFAVTILSVHQEPIARLMADRQRPAGIGQFSGIACRPGRITGAPLLDGGVAFAECTVARMLRAGDHEVVLAEVEDLAIGARDAPLTFFGGRYGRFEPMPAPDQAHEQMGRSWTLTMS
jgi:flavin reductase (DIM6/NTAB) family NADH-FMN oxidoreductase RutF